MTDLEKLTKEVADLREEVRRLKDERQTPFYYPRWWPSVDYSDPRLTAAAVVDTSGWMMARAVYHALPTITLTNEG